MKITGGNAAAAVHAQENRVKDADAANTLNANVTSSQPAGELKSASLQPALNVLREMQDFDQAKVDALREALAKGEVVFDAAKLAGLIQRFHGKE